MSTVKNNYPPKWGKYDDSLPELICHKCGNSDRFAIAKTHNSLNILCTYLNEDKTMCGMSTFIKTGAKE